MKVYESVSDLRSEIARFCLFRAGKRACNIALFGAGNGEYDGAVIISLHICFEALFLLCGHTDNCAYWSSN